MSRHLGTFTGRNLAAHGSVGDIAARMAAQNARTGSNLLAFGAAALFLAALAINLIALFGDKT